jgi:hypothetical protein
MSLGRFRFWRGASQIVRFATIAFATVTIHTHIAGAPVLSSDCKSTCTMLTAFLVLSQLGMTLPV